MEMFENQKNCLTPHSVSLRSVRLRAVLALKESDSVSVSRRGITYFANISAKTNLSEKNILACLSGAEVD